MSLLPEILFFLFYLRVSDVYICNQIIFRSFHCTSLALLSFKNMMQYGFTLVELQHPIQTILSNVSLSLISLENDKYKENNYYQIDEHFFIKMIVLYFLVYLIYDLKHCNKRNDLLIHHIVCFVWGLLNYNYYVGYISVTIIAEGVTFAYFIPILKYQYIYRLVFTTFVRVPLWIINIYWLYLHDNIYIINIINMCVFIFMFCMDCIWLNQNLKKIKQCN